MDIDHHRSGWSCLGRFEGRNNEVVLLALDTDSQFCWEYSVIYIVFQQFVSLNNSRFELILRTPRDLLLCPPANRGLLALNVHKR